MSNETNDSTKAEPSGPKAEKEPAGHDADPHVRSNTPENAEGELKPSSPGETGTTPGSDWKK